MNLPTDASTRVRIRTNAKLNLFLRVVGTRPDGYHELESIFHGIGLGDDIEIQARGSRGVEVDMTLDPGLVGDIPSSKENLVARAVERLIERGAPQAMGSAIAGAKAMGSAIAGAKAMGSAIAGANVGLRIHITKRIPIAAGLGGGSGNAAGALVALSELWDLGLETDELRRIGALIGSDVPYCIGGGTALAMKRGEDLTPLPAPAQIWFVLGISFRPLLTKDVYDAWDAIDPIDDAGSAPMSFALGSGDVTEIATLLHNDLERGAFRLWPELEMKKRAMIVAGALGAALTGSGPTVYGIARDESHARAIAEKVEGHFDRVLVVSSHPRCVERLD